MPCPEAVKDRGSGIKKKQMRYVVLQQHSSHSFQIVCCLFQVQICRNLNDFFFSDFSSQSSTVGGAI